jgi:hypothetical protein
LPPRDVFAAIQRNPHPKFGAMVARSCNIGSGLHPVSETR